MRERPDLLTGDSPEGLRVSQLTTEESPSSHIYMEAQIFTPDSRRFLLHHPARAHGIDFMDPARRYLVCDLDSSGELTPITEETGATAPSVSPDGESLYYFVDATTPCEPGRLTLKRVGMDGTGREEIAVLDGVPAGWPGPFSRPYSLSTISSDGARLAISGFLGDGSSENAPWGLVVFDVASGGVELILQGPSWCNVHAQYCRSTDPEAARDILIQENHGNLCDAAGRCTRLVGGEGADVHVIRDDGTGFRDMPWGRDGNEFCQGHQCWIGRGQRAITSTMTREPDGRELIEGRAAPHAGHQGRRTPGGERNDLSRGFPAPDFCHFATDIAGRRLISDSGPQGRGRRPVAGPPARRRPVADRGLDVAAEPALDVAKGEPHPPLPVSGRAHGVLQLRRERRPPVLHGEGLGGLDPGPRLSSRSPRCRSGRGCGPRPRGWSCRGWRPRAAPCWTRGW